MIDYGQREVTVSLEEGSSRDGNVDSVQAVKHAIREVDLMYDPVLLAATERIKKHS